MDEIGQSVFKAIAPQTMWLTPPLRMIAGERVLEHQFLVADTYTSVILGMDIFRLLGITISNLPSSYPQQAESSKTDIAGDGRSSGDASSDPKTYQPATVHENDSAVETHTTFSGLRRIDLRELGILMDEIEQSLAENGKIGEDKFCSHPEAEVKLDLTDDTPVYRPQYEIPKALHPIVDEQIETWLKNKKIEAASPLTRLNSSLLMVPKMDLYGSKKDWRTCFDARGINPRLPMDTYGIPRIRELFKRIAGFRYCSSLDLVAAYQQMKVRKEDRFITCFTWAGKRYQFVGAPFGLTQLPGQFQRLMNAVLMQHSDYVVVYIDDVFIFSNSLADHIRQCNAVIQTLTEHNLRLRRGKCHFGYLEAVLLGHVVSGDHIRIDPRKVSTFAELVTPRTGKQVQALLGFAGYLRDYIPNFAQIAAPLEKIKMLKSVVEVWSQKEQEALEMFKQVLSSAPLISHPNLITRLKLRQIHRNSGTVQFCINSLTEKHVM